ncbi:hypothetical protein [Roseomonas sp. CECT 9278]|uniref:hypothetical protein n=1 Tax=Roseomonas sp. CECT 9278 TaxID=2845823 RepID=UPI001E5CE94D|nr:hypothetical protein [Roseomonas sp. CECT 9278]CAH0294687.1 hypothetical protein ROS9278_04338 [Roseomonas sp. CECT 9278]
MSMTLPDDPLMLLLHDQALLAALLAGHDPALAPAVPGAPAPLREDAPPPPPAADPQAAAEPQAVPQPEPDPPFALVPEDAFPTIAELDALLADSYAPEPGLDRATRIEFAEAFGIDPALIDDEQAFLAALAALEPPPEDDLPEQVSGEPSPAEIWGGSVREDWALG